MGLISQSTEVLEFHVGNMAAEVAVHTGWRALRSVFPTWSIGVGSDQVVAHSRFAVHPTRESQSRESPEIQGMEGSLCWSLLTSQLRRSEAEDARLRQFNFGQLAEEIGRSRNWPKSKLAKVEIGQS